MQQFFLKARCGSRYTEIEIWLCRKGGRSTEPKGNQGPNQGVGLHFPAHGTGLLNLVSISNHTERGPKQPVSVSYFAGSSYF